MILRSKAAVAVAAFGVMAFGGVGLINAEPASAEVLTATGGSLQWGLKTSLLSYHFSLHAGTTQGVTQGDGATPSSATRGSGAEIYPASWIFPFVSGSYDSTTNKYTAQYGGYVALTESNPAASEGPGSASPFKNFKISNPKVVIDIANGVKQLVLDIDEGDDGDPATPVEPIAEDVDFASFPNLTSAATASGGAVTYTELAAALTATGSAAFGGFYGEGVELDPVTTTLTGLAAGGGGGPPFANCTAARAAGYSDIPSTSSAYKADLDADLDGIACEDGEGTDSGSSGSGSSGGGSATGGGTTTGGGTATGGGTTSGTTFAAGPPPPPQGGWFGPPMPQGGSQYNPPPWFRPPPPYGMMPPPQYQMPQQQYPQQQLQYVPQYAPPASVSTPLAVAAPPAPDLGSTTSVAAPPRISRPIPRPTGPADGETVSVNADGEIESDSGGIAMLAVVLAIGGGIAYFTTRGVRDLIAVRSGNRAGRR